MQGNLESSLNQLSVGKVKCVVYLKIVEVAEFKVTEDEEVYVDLIRCPLAVSYLNGYGGNRMKDAH